MEWLPLDTQPWHKEKAEPLFTGFSKLQKVLGIQVSYIYARQAMSFSYDRGEARELLRTLNTNLPLGVLTDDLLAFGDERISLNLVLVDPTSGEFDNDSLVVTGYGFDADSGEVSRVFPEDDSLHIFFSYEQAVALYEQLRAQEAAGIII